MDAKETGRVQPVKVMNFPHTFVIILAMIVVALILTWVVPAGMYDFIKTPSGQKVVDPATFRYIKSTGINPVLIPLYIIKSFSKRIDLMMVIFMAGSAFHVVTKTGALQAILAKGAKRFSNRLEVFIPVLTLIFGLICTTQGVNTFIPFAPVMVMLAMAMGLDSITGEAIMVLGGAIGFSTGTFNMFTTVVAQDIAELPAYSGLWYRAVCFVVFYIVTNWYLIRYAKKIKKNPTMSPMFDLDQEMKAEEATMDLEAASELTGRMLAPLVLLVIAFALRSAGPFAAFIGGLFCKNVTKDAGFLSILSGTAVAAYWTYALKSPFGLSAMVPGGIVAFAVLFIVSKYQISRGVEAAAPIELDKE